MLLLSSKVVLLYTFTTVVAAVLLVMPLRAVEGAYVDKPVCNVCTCSANTVTCKANLPEPARWGDESDVENVYIAVGDLTKLEEGAFDGLSLNSLYIRGNPKLKKIEAGALKGINARDEVHIEENNELHTFEAPTFGANTLIHSDHSKLIVNNNPKLGSLPAEVFSKLVVGALLQIRGNPKLTVLVAGTFKGVSGGQSGAWIAEVIIENNQGITTIEAKAFSGLRAKKFIIQGNNALVTVESGAFEDTEIETSFSFNSGNAYATAPPRLFNGLKVGFRGSGVT